jgi:nucleoid-associated protein YgaU
MLSRPFSFGVRFGTFLGLLLLPAFALAATPPHLLAELRTKAEKGDDIAQYNLGSGLCRPRRTDCRSAGGVCLAHASPLERGTNDLVLRKLTERLTSAQVIEAKRRLDARRTTLAQARAVMSESDSARDSGTSAERSPFVTPDCVRRPFARRDSRPGTGSLAAQVGQAPAEHRAVQRMEGNRSRQVRFHFQGGGAQPDHHAAPELSLPLKPTNSGGERLDGRIRGESAGPEADRRNEGAIVARSRRPLGGGGDASGQLAAEQRTRADLAAKSMAATDSSGRSAAEIEALKRELGTVSASLRSEQQEKEQLTGRYTAAQQEKSDLEKQLKNAVAKSRSVPAAEQEISSLRAALSEARDESAKLRTEVSKAQQSATATQQTAASEAVVLLQTQLEQSQRALHTVENERDGLKQQLAAAPAPSGSGESLETLTRQLAESETKLSTALRSYTLLREELDASRKSMGNLESERASLLAKVEAAASERASLSGELTAKSATAAEVDTMRDQLRSALAEVSALRTTTAQLTPAASEASMLREQLRQTQQQGAAAALELSQLRTRLALLAPASTGSLAAPTRPGAQTVSFAAPPPLPPAETRTPAASAAAGGTSSATTGPAASGVRTHVIQTGDTLSRIATRYYGDAKRWNEIVEANREVIPSPDRLAVGMTLKIP